MRIFQFISCAGTAALVSACASQTTVDPVGAKLSAVTTMETEEQAVHDSLFSWPVEQALMTRGFLPNGTKKRHRPHFGIDLAANKGTPILAAQDGVVVYVGSQFHGYGKMIMVEGRRGFASLYAHLSKALAKQGTAVKKGQVIGYMGRTGHASGVHLHFEIRKNRGPVDPLLYLPESTAFKD